MRILNRAFVYEFKGCPVCNGTGEVREYLPCPRDRRIQRGKACPHCGATRKDGHHWFETGKMALCGRCEGTGEVLEDRCSFLSEGIKEEILGQVPVVFMGGHRAQTLNEAYLGLGCVSSVTDYRNWCECGPEEAQGLVEEVKREFVSSTCQPATLLDRRGKLCAQLGVFPNSQGYSVRPLWA